MRKLILSFLTIIMVICCVGLWACITPETPPVEHTHNFSTEWIVDNTNHWRECECGEKSELSMHTPGAEATQTTPQTCTVCGYVVKEALGEEPTPEVPEHTHEYTYLTKNDYHHWYECECGENNGKSEHSGGTATCLKKAVCKICGQEYGDLVEHSYDYVIYDSVNHWYECECGDKKDVKEHIPGAPATETTHQTCTECGYIITPAIGHVHSYSKVKYDKVNHWNECECGNKEDIVKHTITSQPKDGAGDKHVCEEREYLNKCDDCDYSYDSTITLGHKYVKIAEGNYEYGCQSFNVLLECEECSSFIKVVATKMGLRGTNDEHGSVEKDCKSAGFDEYSYTYTNTDGTAPVETTGYIIKKKSGPPSAEHTFISGDFKFMSALNAQHHYGKANGAALTALLENEVIRPVAGAPVLCTTFVTVVGDCAVCDHPITFDITGEHNFLDKYGKEVEVPATCVTDAYFECQNAGCTYHETTALAEGHVWEYKKNTFDKATMTVTLECAECKATKSSVAVKFVEEQIAKTCAEYTVNVYKTIDKITNGLAATHENFNEEFVICDVIRYGEVKYHTITANGVTINNLVLSSELIGGLPVVYAYNNDFVRLFTVDNRGVMRWVNGVPNCANHRIAVFDCSVCGEPITINLTGAHTEVGDMKTKDATCVKYGYEYKECTVTNCLTGGEVVYKYIDATEHNFIADAASEAAFMANPAVGGKVTFKCACNTTVDFVCTNILARIPGDMCTADRIPYVFEYSYTVINYDEAEKKEVNSVVNANYILYGITGSDSHRLVCDGKFIDDISHEQLIDKDSNILLWWDAVDKGSVRWIAGVPANCLETKEVVFFCYDCGYPIIVELYGKCDVGGDGQCKICGEHCT